MLHEKHDIHPLCTFTPFAHSFTPFEGTSHSPMTRLHRNHEHQNAQIKTAVTEADAVELCSSILARIIRTNFSKAAGSPAQPRALSSFAVFPTLGLKWLPRATITLFTPCVNCNPVDDSHLAISPANHFRRSGHCAARSTGSKGDRRKSCCKQSSQSKRAHHVQYIMYIM